MLSSGCQASLSNTRASAGHVGSSAPRLDILQLEDNVSEYLEKAPCTLQSYRAGKHRYLNFCHSTNLPPSSLSENTLSMFVTFLAKEGLQHQTIKCYLSAVRYFHIMAGYGDPFCPGAFPLLQYVLRGIKRSPRQPIQQRLPITPQSSAA